MYSVFFWTLLSVHSIWMIEPKSFQNYTCLSGPQRTLEIIDEPRFLLEETKSGPDKGMSSHFDVTHAGFQCPLIYSPAAISGHFTKPRLFTSSSEE